ncbi:hypothetical protein HNP84_004556 [Thermocatellispora tengchongensis]|uniref:Protein-glutamine gamma-glutamyltransferase-like C-terminal domain-containing protein n=1 Tax=Thermocatellispora tengchongensis TaxID=1073253 RepID=A0A840P657_9ACTN|nr:DUF4129 domain-containing protein [Thermocatellispora tengchongensis]MBB5134822.1 hypothetical protein [Thermocatellispora tengchongensis]
MTTPYLLLSPPVDIERGEAQGRALRELLGGRYEHESLPDRVMRTVQQYLGDLFDTTAGPAGGLLAVAGIVLVLGGLVALLVWQAKRASRGRAKRAAEDIFGARARSAAEHRAESERLAAEGQYAEAVRERLRAVARDLEERAVVDGLPGRTADELAREAGRALPAFAADLAAAARVFDDVTYGEVPGTPAAYETLRSLDERLRAAKPALAEGAR